MKITRVFDLLTNYQSSYSPSNDVVAIKVNGVWEKYNIQQFIEKVDLLSSALIKIGIKKGDIIVSVLPSCPECLFLDMAITQIGAIHSLINPTSDLADLRFIIHHTETKALFLKGAQLYEKLKEIISELPDLKNIYSLENVDGVQSLDDFYAIGKENLDIVQIKTLKDSVNPHDPALIIYTSGTTGINKGVLLSHEGLMANCLEMSGVPYFGEGTRSLSFLPMSHIFERQLNYMCLCKGISIFYAESIPKFLSNCQEVGPAMMCCVPRFLEEVYRAIVAKGKMQKGILRKVFFWAVELAKKNELDGSNSIFYKLQLAIANKLVLHKIGDAMGGNLKFIACGGSSMDPQLFRLFWASKVPIYEGYGLTETSPVIATARPQNKVKIGTIGKPLNCATVKIADNNEILVKGISLMIGYYKDPEQTAQAIDSDGWFHTGDAGGLDEDGYLFVIGRMKQNFKTSGGKWIISQNIEQKLMASEYISYAIVVGENQIVVGALIVPNFNSLQSWCQANNIQYTTNEEMIKNPQIVALIDGEVKNVNLNLQMTDRVRPICIIADQWSTQTGEITSNLKVRRDVVIAKYSDKIAEMYKD